jgi:ubiquinone/menaquinone biosynthesis C-methylase UbiE
MNLVRARSSLARVLEPEVMDSSDEARNYDAMDHAEVNHRFAADFLAACAAAGLPDDERVLDLGTGTAQIPIELCAQNPRAMVVAIDLADEMLKLARRNVERSGLADRIRVERADAKRLAYRDGQFAAVMSNSIVHHIPEPRTVLAEAVRVVRRPGGLVFVRDLARPYDDAEVRHLVATYAGGCNAQQRKLFDDSLRAALSVDEMRLLVAELGFERRDVSATSDRHWTWCALAGA